MPATERIDTLVVGAGVVGLAAARALAQSGREVVVAERETAIGTGVSARNSEVIHAGLYYSTGSLKARLCVRGKELLYRYGAERGIAHRNCGKLVVATDEAQCPALRALVERATANGVELQWLDAAQALRLEPELRCVAALHSPSTGIIDSHALMLSLQADLEAAGGMVALDSTVQAVRAVPEGFVVQVSSGNGAVMELLARQLVNAAGLHACQVARAINGLDPRHVPQPHYAKGSYFTLSGRAPFSRLIYPAPQDAWLGVHLTLDLGGQARFGPDQEWLPDADPSTLDYSVDASRGEAFYAEVRRYWPALPDGALQADYSGVRPRIHGPGQSAPDFRIDGPAQHRVPGLVNLLGIESPGLTASMAIAEEVLRRLGD